MKRYWHWLWFKDVTPSYEVVYGGSVRRKYKFRWQLLFNLFIIGIIIVILILM